MKKGRIVKGIIIILYTIILKALELLFSSNKVIELIGSTLILIIGFFFWDIYRNRIINCFYRLTGTSGKEKSTQELVSEFENTVLPAHSRIVEANKLGSAVPLNDFMDLYYYWGKTIIFLHSNCFDNGFNTERVKKIIRSQDVSQAIVYRYCFIDPQHVKLIVSDLSTFLEKYRGMIEKLPDFKELEEYLKNMNS